MALSVDSSPDLNTKDNFETWSGYDWKDMGDEWSQSFGGTATMWHAIILPRVHRFLNCDHILEIAPGHGRCTQYLLPRCNRLTIVDLVPRCIEACRQRFSNDPRIRFVVNDGLTLPGTADQSVDFVFSWDSLVHVDRDPIRSYLVEIARVLKPNGHAFLHHSNLGMQIEELSPEDRQLPFGFRRPTVSATTMATDCRAAGLWCAAQELIPEARVDLFNDCFTLIKNDTSRAHIPSVVKKRSEWGKEIGIARDVAAMYDVA